MVPGPDQIVVCPCCRGLARYMTLRSGNTFGATVWTDGKQVAPMLPRPPEVVKCRHCEECYWLEDAEEVGVLDYWDGEAGPIDPAWREAGYVEEPSEGDYYRAIEGGLARDREREKSLRILAWWRRNDAFRARDRWWEWLPRILAWWRRNEAFRAALGVDAPDDWAGTDAPAPVDFRDNLRALAELLDEDHEDDLVMKAEVLRELGEFEAALAVLKTIGPGESAAAVRQLRALCRRRDAGVRRLRSDD